MTRQEIESKIAVPLAETIVVRVGKKVFEANVSGVSLTKDLSGAQVEYTCNVPPPTPRKQQASPKQTAKK